MVDPAACRAPLTAGDERIAAANDDVANFANHQLVLTSLVVSRLPTEQIAVEGRRRLVVSSIEREMIEPDGFPSRRRDRKWLGQPRRGRGLSLASVAVGVADLQ